MLVICIININCSYYVRPIKESKQDRLKKVDPMLLFPMKAWLRGFLPGHKFTWEDEANFTDEVDVQKKVKITVAYFISCGRSRWTAQ